MANDGKVVVYNGGKLTKTGATDTATIDGNLIVSGDLTIDGDSVTNLGTTVQYVDNLLELGLSDDGDGTVSAPGSSTTKDLGFLGHIHNGSAASKIAFAYDMDASQFVALTGVTETNGAVSGTKANISANIVGTVSSVANHDTDALSEGSSNLYHTDARARAAVSVTDAGGDGSMGYNSSTGVITYTGPSAAEVRAHISAGEGIDISNGVISAELATETNAGIATFDGTDFTVSTSGDVTVNAERVQDIAGAMFSSNTETLITASYQDSDGTIDLVVDNDLSNYDNSNSAFITAAAVKTDEQIQDIAGAMFSSNTETGITASYQDSDGTIDLVVADQTLEASSSGATNLVLTMSNPGSADTITVTAAGALAVTSASAGAVTLTATNTQLSTEEVQDIAGPLVADGGTKTRIAVTYDDANNNMDFVVDGDLANYDNSSSGFITAASSSALTNKTFDADGTGNVLSNIDIGNMTAAVIVLESEGIGSNDNDTTLPTSAAVKDYVDAQDAAIASDTLTFTNKTFDADGTGNSISNLAVADFAPAAIVLESEGIANNDNDTSLPTSAAVKDFVDGQISTTSEQPSFTVTDGSFVNKFFDTAEAISAGNLLYLASNNAVGKANGTLASKDALIGIAIDDAAHGSSTLSALTIAVVDGGNGLLGLAANTNFTFDVDVDASGGRETFTITLVESSTSGSDTTFGTGTSATVHLNGKANNSAVLSAIRNCFSTSAGDKFNGWTIGASNVSGGQLRFQVAAPAAGNSGYDFLNVTNQIQVSGAGELFGTFQNASAGSSSKVKMAIPGSSMRGFNFASGYTVGQELYLTTNGAMSTTAPTTGAVVRAGYVGSVGVQDNGNPFDTFLFLPQFIMDN